MQANHTSCPRTRRHRTVIVSGQPAFVRQSYSFTRFALLEFRRFLITLQHDLSRSVDRGGPLGLQNW